MDSGPDDGSARVALVAFLGRHQAWMQAYAMAIVRDPALADDVVQEASLAVAMDWPRMPADTRDELSWTAAILRRRALSCLRRFHRPTMPLDEDLLVVLAQEMETVEADARQLREQRLRTCLGRLRGDASRVIAGRYWQGRTSAQLAVDLRRSEQAVNSILFRARRALAVCLGREAAHDR